MSEDDLALLPDNELAKLLAPMPQAPRQEAIDMLPSGPNAPRNFIQHVNGPEAGKVIDLDKFIAENRAYEQQKQAAQPQFQPRSINAIGTGNGTTAQLGQETLKGPVSVDFTRSPLEIMGGAKAYYSKDEPGIAYVLDGSGQPKSKVYIGYDMKGSMALNKANAEMEHLKAQTAELSAPKYQLTPEGDVFDTKSGTLRPGSGSNNILDRQRQKAAYDMGLKELQKDDAQVQATNDIEQRLKQWAELQPKVTTGRLAGLIPAIMQPDRQTLESIENYLAMNNFKPGQGSMSNMERGLIKGGGPKVTNDEETNNDIVKVMLGGVQNLRERDFFKQQYLQARNSLLGADQAWQQYIEANPRYMSDPKTGRIVDNPNRVDWQTYFSGGGRAQPSASTQTSGGSVRPGEMRKGYVYVGGDPASPASWKKVSG